MLYLFEYIYNGELEQFLWWTVYVSFVYFMVIYIYIYIYIIIRRLLWICNLKYINLCSILTESNIKITVKIMITYFTCTLTCQRIKISVLMGKHEKRWFKTMI